MWFESFPTLQVASHGWYICLLISNCFKYPFSMDFFLKGKIMLFVLCLGTGCVFVPYLLQWTREPKLWPQTIWSSIRTIVDFQWESILASSVPCIQYVIHFACFCNNLRFICYSNTNTWRDADSHAKSSLGSYEPSEVAIFSTMIFLIHVCWN